VAAYNAFLSLGKNIQPDEIVKYIENNHGLILDGAFGVNPFVFDGLFKNFGEEAKTYSIFEALAVYAAFNLKSNLDNFAKSGRTAILCYAHSSGAHYINITWDAQTSLFTAHNTKYGLDTFASIPDYLQLEPRIFLSLTVIK